MRSSQLLHEILWCKSQMTESELWNKKLIPVLWTAIKWFHNSSDDSM